VLALGPEAAGRGTAGSGVIGAFLLFPGMPGSGAAGALLPLLGMPASLAATCPARSGDPLGALGRSARRARPVSSARSAGQLRALLFFAK